MNSKERMLCALNREKPDRLPVTVHQWQQYHLDNYMGGITPQAAFRATGLDAAVSFFIGMGALSAPTAEGTHAIAPGWVDTARVIQETSTARLVHHTIATPDGELTFAVGANPTTSWMVEHMIKRPEDLDLIEAHMPIPRLDKAAVARAYDELGDDGILRGFVWGDQGGCWQHACCLMDPETLILACYDRPAWVHRLLSILLVKKLRYIAESLDGTRFDLIETGGGSASDTLISPKLHAEFCLPYDRQMHRALHALGHKAVYHTCGGMIHILDLILANECDASETLSPPSVGGNIADPAAVRAVFGGKIAMIGGMDQFSVLTAGTPEQIRAEVRRLFEGFGPEGGYMLCASDHFFETPVENLKIYAEAAHQCRY
jgi:uroporphyrinogen-III decarboxylase